MTDRPIVLDDFDPKRAALNMGVSIATLEMAMELYRRLSVPRHRDKTVVSGLGTVGAHAKRYDLEGWIKQWAKAHVAP